MLFVGAGVTRDKAIGNAKKITFKFTLKTLTERQSLMSYGRSFQLVAAECL